MFVTFFIHCTLNKGFDPDPLQDNFFLNSGVEVFLHEEAASGTTTTLPAGVSPAAAVVTSTTPRPGGISLVRGAAIGTPHPDGVSLAAVAGTSLRDGVSLAAVAGTPHPGGVSRVGAAIGTARRRTTHKIVSPYKR